MAVNYTKAGDRFHVLARIELEKDGKEPPRQDGTKGRTKKQTEEEGFTRSLVGFSLHSAETITNNSTLSVNYGRFVRHSPEFTS